MPFEYDTNKSSANLENMALIFLKHNLYGMMKNTLKSLLKLQTNRAFLLLEKSKANIGQQ